MKALLPFALSLLSNYKVYISGVGAIGLAIYWFSQGNSEAGSAALLAGLTAIGLRHETAPTVPAPPATESPK